MKPFLLTIAFCLLNVQFIASQLTTCNDCYYGECETLTGSNQFACHCVANVKGRQCEECLYPGESLCLSNPCWNGGSCQDKGTNYTCACRTGFSGRDCRTVVKNLADKYIRVLNKGGYTALLTVEYFLPGQGTIKQTGSITSGQSYAFYIPGAVNYLTEEGPVLEVRALGGIRVFAKKITADPECFDVWGTTLNGRWSNVNC